jgi:hypothetical protein
MKSLLIIALTIMAFLLLPVLAYAQTYEAAAPGAGPPLAQPLVREGTLAVTLAGALQLGQTSSEVDAESLLSRAGIAPRNGWIADYPVTPDIAAELRSAVADAATAGSLTMGTNAALAAFDDVMSRYNLSVRADTSGQVEADQSAPNYPDTTATNDYYYDYGPPVVTYYAPPVDYAYLYSWVPYPFWWWNVWFPGFYVLADFDVPVFVHGRACFVTNHFSDRDHDRFSRINASDRLHSSNFVNRKAVVGPAVVSAGAQTSFRRFGSGAVNGRFETREGRVITPRTGNVRMHSPVRSDNAVPQENRTFGKENAMSRQFERSTRTYAPPANSYSAPAPGQVSPSFGGGRPFEGFRGGSFGGRR